MKVLTDGSSQTSSLNSVWLNRLKKTRLVKTVWLIRDINSYSQDFSTVLCFSLSFTWDILLQWANSASRRMTSVDSLLISCCDQRTSLMSISSLWKPRWDPEGWLRKVEDEDEVDVREAVVTGRTAGDKEADWADCWNFWTSSWSPLCRAFRWLISTC